ncbi:MAG: hypothetical protein AAB875_06465 [Patescibacteria group bacterium]
MTTITIKRGEVTNLQLIFASLEKLIHEYDLIIALPEDMAGDYHTADKTHKNFVLPGFHLSPDAVTDKIGEEIAFKKTVDIRGYGFYFTKNGMNHAPRKNLTSYIGGESHE